MILAAIVWGCEKKTWIVPSILMFFAVAAIIIFCCLFRCAKKNIVAIPIQIKSFKWYDDRIVLYLLTYMLPLASFAFEDINAAILIAVTTIILIGIPWLHASVPHFLLRIQKYHFYLVDFEDGMKDCLIISKRKLRDVQSIKNALRLMENVFIETERKPKTEGKTSA
jgi:hypothetical protein